MDQDVLLLISEIAGVVCTLAGYWLGYVRGAKSNRD